MAGQDQGDYAKSQEYDEKSLELRKTILALKTTNAGAQLDLADTYTHLGDTLLKKGDPAGAIAETRQAQTIAEKAAAAADPNDQRAKSDMADAYYELGAALRLQGNFATALDFGRRTIKIDADLMALDPVNMDLKEQLGQANCLLDVYLARGLKVPAGQISRSSDLKGPLSSYQKASYTYRALRRAGALPYSLISELERISREILHCNALLGKPRVDSPTPKAGHATDSNH